MYWQFAAAALTAIDFFTQLTHKLLPSTYNLASFLNIPAISLAQARHASHRWWKNMLAGSATHFQRLNTGNLSAKVFWIGYGGRWKNWCVLILVLLRWCVSFTRRHHEFLKLNVLHIVNFRQLPSHTTPRFEPLRTPIARMTIHFEALICTCETCWQLPTVLAFSIQVLSCWWFVLVAMNWRHLLLVKTNSASGTNSFRKKESGFLVQIL